MHVWKRTLAGLLALALVAGYSAPMDGSVGKLFGRPDLTAFAEGENVHYTPSSSAIPEADFVATSDSFSGSGTYTLLSDVELNKPVTMIGDSVTLDLNGHKLTMQKGLTIGGTLTVMDTSENKEGKLIVEDPGYYLDTGNGKNAIEYDVAGKLVLESGSVIATGGYAGFSDAPCRGGNALQCGSLTVNGGILKLNAGMGTNDSAYDSNYDGKQIDCSQPELVRITGGTMNFDPSAYSVPAGYLTKKNEDETWTVTSMFATDPAITDTLTYTGDPHALITAGTLADDVEEGTKVWYGITNVIERNSRDTFDVPTLKEGDVLMPTGAYGFYLTEGLNVVCNGTAYSPCTNPMVPHNLYKSGDGVSFVYGDVDDTDYPKTKEFNGYDSFRVLEVNLSEANPYIVIEPYDSTNAWSENPPTGTNAGNYDVFYRITDGPTTEIVPPTFIGTATIDQAQVSPTPAQNLTYKKGEEQALVDTTGVPAGVTVEYTQDMNGTVYGSSEDYYEISSLKVGDVLKPNASEDGIYLKGGTFRLCDADAVNATQFEYWAVSIYRNEMENNIAFQPNVDLVSGYSKLYSADEYDSFMVSEIATDGTVTFIPWNYAKNGTSFKWSAEMPKGEDAGTYDIWYHFTDTNYTVKNPEMDGENSLGFAKVTATIAPQETEVKAVNGLTYKKGEEHALVDTTGVPEGVTVEYMTEEPTPTAEFVREAKIEANKWVTTCDDQKKAAKNANNDKAKDFFANAGIAAYCISMALEEDNSDFIVTAKQNIYGDGDTIKALSTLMEETGDYAADEQEVYHYLTGIVKEDSTLDSIKASLQDPRWSAEMPKGENAGTYDIWYRFADTNYTVKNPEMDGENSLGFAKLTATIDPATLSLGGVTETYSGKDIKLVKIPEDFPAGVTVEYIVSSADEKPKTPQSLMEEFFYKNAEYSALGQENAFYQSASGVCYHLYSALWNYLNNGVINYESDFSMAKECMYGQDKEPLAAAPGDDEQQAVYNYLKTYLPSEDMTFEEFSALLNDERWQTMTGETFPKGTDAGEYTVYYRFTGDNVKNYTYTDAEGEAVQDYGTLKSEITKTQAQLMEASSIGDPKIYDGTERKLDAACTSFDGTVVYSLDGENYTKKIPTVKDAGKYTVYVKVIGDKNHTDSDVEEIKDSIAPKAVTATITAANKSCDGNTTAELTVTADSGIEGETITITGVTGTFDSANSGTGKTVKIDASKAVVTVDGGKAENYTITFPETVKADITPLETAISVKLDGWTYDGTSHTPEVITEDTAYKAAIGAGNVTYTYKQGDAVLDKAPVDAGTYTVTATVSGVDNYEDAVNSAEFTIAKADINPIVSITGWTYGATANTLTVTDNPGNGAVTYEYKVKGAEDSTYSTTVPTAAGEYTVRATIADTANYLGVETTADFTIAKKSLTVTADKASKVYGTDDPALTYTSNGLVGEDKITGELARAEGENVGEYAITQGTLTAGENYAIKFVPAEFTITAAQFDVDAKGFEGTFDGKAHGISASTKVEGAKVMYLAAEGENVPTEDDFVKANLTASPTFTDAGTYKVWYCITTPNYKTVVDYKTVTIAKASIKPVVTLAGWTYGEDANKPELIGNDGNATATFAFYQGEEKLNGVPTNAGTYKVVATVPEATNYLGGETDVEFTIAKAKLTVTVESAIKVEGDADPAFTYKTSGLVGDDKIEVSLTRENGETAGKYAIAADVKASDNYEVKFVGAELTITAKPAEEQPTEPTTTESPETTKAPGEGILFKICIVFFRL